MQQYVTPTTMASCRAAACATWSGCANRLPNSVNRSARSEVRTVAADRASGRFEPLREMKPQLGSLTLESPNPL